jgi:aspartyl-tRNA(Asn)/glutamyl-tRNA(Gln) amidotransferase subunit A
MPIDPNFASGAEIAGAVRAGDASAVEIIDAALAAIRLRDPVLNSFTVVTEERACAKALAIDANRAGGKPLGPLAGVPFAVKNLFDVAGLPTLAGSKINRGRPPAPRDAALIERLEAAGAILVGALNMGEYAYDFTGENIHDGASRNPHDLDRMSGGSSGGSASAVAGGLVPLALGSDTNGSIRVPSSLCGIFGLKPTYGRLSRARTFPFVASLDHVGPLARTAHDLALAYDAMQGFDPEDPVCADHAMEPVVPVLERGADGLRIAVAAGYFKCRTAEACYALDRVASALGANRDIEIPQADRARAAAFVITATEGAALHLDRLRLRAKDYDPDVRDRLIAGAMAPAALVVKAQKFRRWYREQVLKLFAEVDVLLAPATPCTEMPVRANLGIYTQPISFIGLPVVAVPVPLVPLPIAVQIIAAPWREDLALRVAHALETEGVVAAMRPPL